MLYTELKDLILMLQSFSKKVLYILIYFPYSIPLLSAMICKNDLFLMEQDFEK